MKLLSDHSNNIQNQKVILRCNYDVPLKDGNILDDTRIIDSFSTIHQLLENNNQIILLAHAGRPKGVYVQELSLRPISSMLEKSLQVQVDFIDYHDNIFGGEFDINNRITLMDNLRFWPQEKKNDTDFSKKLADLADYYVNESFATSHRQHASIVGIPQHIPGYAGLSLFREVDIITKVKSHPKRPLILIMGGAKLETKEPLIDEFSKIADKILVGGKLALDIQNHHFTQAENVVVADLVESGKDITIDSANHFADIIDAAETVIWNGSMGVFEETEYRQGTAIVAQAINKTSAFSLVGGGDTEAALSQLKLESGIDHISTGGGAMLDLLMHGTLPGLEVLK